MLKLISPDFPDGGEIPSKYTCDGENINPELVLENIPAGTKSLALILDDPDARELFTHWLVWNIDPKTERIGEKASFPKAVAGTNSYGRNNYGGPCPPSGVHHYHFNIFALDAELDLPSGTRADEVKKAMQNHIIEQAELIGLYGRE
jgi:hypothetical protein